MNARKWIALALVCGIPALAWVAYSQTVTQDGQPLNPIPQGTNVTRGVNILPTLIGGVNRVDTTSVAMTLNSDGSLVTKEASPASALLYNYPSIVNQQLIAGNSDSSASYPIAGANHVYLYFTFLDSSVTQCSLWAVQIRRHQNTSVDSLSAWPIMSVPTNTTTTPLNNFIRNSATDTLGATLNTSVAPVMTSPMPMEILIAWPNGAPAPRRQFSMELTDRNGMPITGTYLSVRARLLAVYKGGAGTISARSIIRIDMQATR